MSSPPLTPLAAAVLHVGEPERILQLECCADEGEGPLFLAREFPNARVRGVDRDAAAIASASARVGLDPEGRIAFKQGSPRSLPFPENQFDLLVSLDARPGAAEAGRVLRPGGFLVLAVSRGTDPLGGFGGRLYRRRLHQHGFMPIWEQAAGDGSFSISRLRGGGPVGGGL